MSYTANQYNYATPPYGQSRPVLDKYTADTTKYFTIFGNVLDGSFHPISGNVGTWGSSISGTDGMLEEPFVFSVYDTMYINSFRLIGSKYSYPVDFKVEFYNDSTLVYSINETGNTNEEYFVYFTSTIVATSYTVTIYKINASNEVARLHNVYNPGYIKRQDTLKLLPTESNIASVRSSLYRLETAAVSESSITHITNIIDRTFDELSVSSIEEQELTNIHTVMKQPSRKVYGKVYITYTDPMLEIVTNIQATSEAYNSDKQQLLDTIGVTDRRYFTLYDNDLSGNYVPSNKYSQVGWVSAVISDANGEFSQPPSVTIAFESRPISSLKISFDDSHGALAKDFIVRLGYKDGSNADYQVVDNTEATVNVISDGVVADVAYISVIVSKVTRPYSPAAILEIPVSSTILYKGYEDVSELMSIDFLEELTYQDEVEALGGVSANEVTVVLDNSSKDFFFNSGSPVANQLRRNRKVAPWLGAEVIPGEIEWHSLGTFWTHKWDVPVNGLSATAVAFDTIGLLSLTDYSEHHVQVNKSIGELIEYVLNNARILLPFIEYIIDDALYDIIIPYAWFERSNHAAALRKISECFPMHIYCDRDGRICAKPQKLHFDFYYDEWSDSTNIISKNYSSLYTTLPNIVNVSVSNMQPMPNTELYRDDRAIYVEGSSDVSLVFNMPYVSDLSVEVVCDSSISYTYKEYSWGILIKFVGTGTVESVRCFGTGLDAVGTSTVTRQDNESIRLDGAVTRTVASDFIQTTELATLIVDRIFSLSEFDKFDATVNYRGDISLSINDSIILHDGIAPDNRYNIKRHKLSWNGGLTGSADLNT